MRALWARLRAAWVTLTGTGTAASAAFGLLVFAAVAASLAVPRESAGLRTTALQRVIAASQPGERTVIGTLGETTLAGPSGSQVTASGIAAAGSAVRAKLAAGGLRAASDPPAWEGLTTGFVPVTGAAQPARYGRPQLEMAYRTELGRYSRIVAGRYPVGGTAPAVAGQPAVVQAAVTTAVAARFGLRAGDRLGAGPVQLVITGIIQPVSPAADFWTVLPAAVTPAVSPASAPQLPYWIGAAFVGPGALPLIEAGLDTSEMLVTWESAAALGGVTTGQAGGIEANASSLVSQGMTLFVPATAGDVTVTINSQIPSVLAPYIAARNAAAPVLELLYVSLAALGAVVVLLGARLVAQRRAGEFTLMRARGAALYQLGWLVLRSSVVIAAVAGAAAAALAIGLTPGDGDAVAWWLAGVTIVVTLAGPVLISLVPQRVAAPVSGRTRRRAGASRPSWVRRVIIEATCVAAAIGGLAVLRNQGLTSGNSGVYQSAAPVLVAIPVAVVVLRCYPLLARELARIAGLSRGVVAFVGLARATRTPAGTVLPSFALVLVLAMVAFPDMISTSVTNSQVAASWQQVGADAVVLAPRDAVIPAALQSQIAAMPGVVSTAAAEVDDGMTAAGYEFPVVFVNPARYAAVVDQAPGTRFPAAALSKPPPPGNGGTVPVLATAAAAQVVGAGPASLTVGSSTVTVQLAGQISGVPGVTGNEAVVVPRQAESGPFAPNLLLVAGPGVNGARLTAAVSRALPGASVTLRATALAALTTAPVLRAAQTALTQGLATAAGFGVLVLLLSLLLTAQNREITLAALATMGLRRWQAQLLLATETLPPVVAAAVGGVACAWLLVPLVGPSLDLAAFSGTGAAIAVAPATFPLVASAVGLVLAALLVLASQAVITYHRGSARALRIAD
jgi:putative ABC transport system permease protein